MSRSVVANVAFKDSDAIVRFVENVYKTFGISASIYKNGKLVAKYELNELKTKEMNYFSNAIFSKFLEDKKSKISAISSGGFLLFGVIYRKYDDVAVCIGPVRTGVITADLYSSLKNIDTSDEKYIVDVFGYLKSMPLVNSERLYRIVDNISLFLCGEPFEYMPYTEGESSVKYNDMVFTRAENGYDEEAKIEFFIKNGMVEKLKTYWENSYKTSYRSASRSLRSAKNNALKLDYLVSRIAAREGLAINAAYSLSDYYEERIELSHTVGETEHIAKDMIVDFAERVAELSVVRTDNPVVIEMIRYITENICEKITCDDLAKRFYLNKSYVSALFKKECNVTLIEYVNIQKINEAKRLLRFSELPIVAIANRLSFSSQAYFQKIFKEVTGKTPFEYRKTGETEAY